MSVTKQSPATESIQKQLYEFAGLQYDKPSNTFSGKHDGFHCLLQLTEAVYILTIAAKPSSEDADEAERLNDTFRTLDKLDNNIQSVQYADRAVIVHFHAHNTVIGQVTAQVLTAICNQMVQMKLIPCCRQCGAEQCSNIGVGDTAKTLCSYCAELAAEDFRKLCTSKPNLLYKLLSALTGGAICFLLIFLMWKVDFIPYFAGAIGAGCALFIAQKLERGLTISTTAMVMVLCLLSCIFTSFFAVGDTLSTAFAELRETTYTDEYQAYCESELDLAEQCSVMSDAELLKTLKTDELDEFKEQLPQYIADLKLELEDITFVKEHTSTFSCIRDLKVVSQWSTDATSISSSISSILLPNALGAVIACLSAFSFAGKLRKLRKQPCRTL